jgi:hypothetical protein
MLIESVKLARGDLVLLDGVRLGKESPHILHEAFGDLRRYFERGTFAKLGHRADM